MLLLILLHKNKTQHRERLQKNYACHLPQCVLSAVLAYSVARSEEVAG